MTKTQVIAVLDQIKDIAKYETARFLAGESTPQEAIASLVQVSIDMGATYEGAVYHSLAPRWRIARRAVTKMQQAIHASME